MALMALLFALLIPFPIQVQAFAPLFDVRPTDTSLHDPNFEKATPTTAGLITPGPKITEQELRARASTATCGFVSGNGGE